MNEPLRWLEDKATTTDLLQVLKAAPQAPEMPLELASKLSVYALGLKSSGAATTVVGTKATLLGVGAAAKLSAAIALFGAAGTVGYTVVDQKISEEGRSRVERVSSREVRGLPVPVAMQPIVAENRSVEVSAGAQKPEVPKGRTRSAAESHHDKSDTPSIADEARLLESARAALGRDPTPALEWAQRHQRYYPDGQLAAERELIAVDALLRLDRREEAERRAAPRLEQAPDSIYARRLRHLLAIEPP